MTTLSRLRWASVNESISILIPLKSRLLSQFKISNPPGLTVFTSSHLHLISLKNRF